MDREVAKRIANSTDGATFIAYIKAQMRELDRVSDIQYTDPQSVALEARSRAKAIETLMHIVSPLLTANEFDIVKQSTSEYAA
jgi:hypothetical protein